MIKRSLMDHIHFHNLIDGQANDKRLIDMARGTELNQVPDIELVKSLVDDIDLSGEYIVVKHSRMRIAYCTFADTRGYLQQRQGSGWEIRSCWFEGTMSSGPLKCWDGGKSAIRPGYRRSSSATGWSITISDRRRQRRHLRYRRWDLPRLQGWSVHRQRHRWRDDPGRRDVVGAAQCSAGTEQCA